MNALRIVLTVLALGWSAAVAAEPVSGADALAKQGQSALRAGDYDAARTAFTKGLREARAADDDTWQARFLFYRGNAHLAQARLTGERGHARRAARDYHEVRKLRPDSGAAMVNLAGALAELGQDDEARALYEAAIGLGDGKEALYRKQYAQFLESRDRAAATLQYREVVKAQPKSVQAQRQLVRGYRDARQGDELVAYLDELIAHGDVLQAQRAALEALQEPQWPRDAKYSLLRVLGDALAAQYVDTDRFHATDAARTLRAVAQREEDEGVRRCIDELLQTLTSPGEPVAYLSWTSDAARADTLSALLRTMARSSNQAGRADRAEQLYRRAVDVDGGDPGAVLELVQFYAERGDVARINEISRDHEFPLFEGKGRAYSAGDEAEIYRYHRTLAAIYASQAEVSGDWGSMSKVNSAAFQLEHAYRTAGRVEGITPDAQLVDQLAKSYEASGRGDDAVALRLNAASNYRVAGNDKAAVKVLRPLGERTLDPAMRERYERIMTQPSPDLQGPDRRIQPPPNVPPPRD